MIALAEDATLTPDDASDVLEELLPAQNKSYELGLKLKLPQHEVEAIHSRHLSSDERLREILIKFLKQAEPRATWRVIIEALRSPTVDDKALARKVEAAHFPHPTAIRDVKVVETTGMSPSALFSVTVLLCVFSQTVAMHQAVLIVATKQNHPPNRPMRLVRSLC